MVPVRITVSDTGIGIPEEARASIFEPFVTVGPSSRRSSGLGLALCDRLTAVMGGRIEVASLEGEGSTFTVNLPLRSATPDIDGGERAASGRTVPAGEEATFDTASRAILIVDDDPMVSEVMASLLEAEGWSTRQASSSAEAIGHLEETRFRAVLTDQRMPGMSGTELARRIRASFADGTPRPVLILMTGGLSREDAARSPELFDAMLFKPVRTSEILRTIEQCSPTGTERPASPPRRLAVAGESLT